MISASVFLPEKGKKSKSLTVEQRRKLTRYLGKQYSAGAYSKRTTSLIDPLGQAVLKGVYMYEVALSDEKENRLYHELGEISSTLERPIYVQMGGRLNRISKNSVQVLAENLVMGPGGFEIDHLLPTGTAAQVLMSAHPNVDRNVAVRDITLSDLGLAPEVTVPESIGALSKIIEQILKRFECFTWKVDPETPIATPRGWPEKFDIAIQTVLGPELDAICSFFGIDKDKDSTSIEGSIFYRGAVESSQSGRRYSVVVFCQGLPGNEASAVTAERLISKFRPSAIFLMGIAAGMRNKVKVGDVVTPRVVVDDTLAAAVDDAQKLYKRTVIFLPPFSMLQMVARSTVSKPVWHKLLLEKCNKPEVDATDADFLTKVAMEPDVHNAAIYSSNTLLRDPEILIEHVRTTHQQIRIGEMEAAGFISACTMRGRPIPWWIVRGVSDFGDKEKRDDWHGWASSSASSYLYCLLRYAMKLEFLGT